MAQINLLAPLRPARRAVLRLMGSVLVIAATAAAVGWYHASLIGRITRLEREAREAREAAAALAPQAQRREALAEELRQLSERRAAALAASRRGAALATLMELAPRGVAITAVATVDGRLDVAATAPSLDALAAYFAALAAAPGLREPRLASAVRVEEGFTVRFSVGLREGR